MVDDMAGNGRRIRRHARCRVGSNPNAPIVFAGDAFGFPNGTGATSRVRDYAKGLTEAGKQVRVLCLLPTDREGREQLNRAASGSFDGVPYAYLCGATCRSESFAQRRVMEIRSAVSLWRELREPPAPAALVSVCSSPLWSSLTMILAKGSSVVCLRESSEAPFVYESLGGLRRLNAWLYLHAVCRGFDGIIVISTYLERYWRDLLNGKVSTLRVPILVDAASFSTEGRLSVTDPMTLLYVGNLAHAGEVETLLEAFAIATDSSAKWRLVVVGDAYAESRMSSLCAAAERLGIGEKVLFTGMQTRQEVIAWCKSASAFALPRVFAKFSEAGFPTKLGEYLASGRPVIVTPTGDIPRYLKDGVDAYFPSGDEAEPFAVRLKHVMEHPEEAERVGEAGAEVARTQFDPGFHARRLKMFVDDLGNRRASRDNVWASVLVAAQACISIAGDRLTSVLASARGAAANESVGRGGVL